MGDQKLNGEAIHGNHVESPDSPRGGAAVAVAVDDLADEASNVRFLASNSQESSSTDGTLCDFIGMKKDELIKFAKDPYWFRIRIILLVLFAALFIGMFVAAIVIIVVAPRCPPRPPQEWYERGVIYHIHTLSFQDTNGDGYGDLKGIQQRLGYLKDELKVDAVSLGPIYPAGFEDDGYDVTFHTFPCPGHYGTWEDFDNLVAALHKAGMKLILDFIPNHTSKKHGWFKKSANITGGDPKYRDFYIWHNGTKSPDGKPIPPNDWESRRGDSAWTYDEQREQFYYHTYSESEPDLNLRNPQVIKQLSEALEIWLMRKVDGFRVRDAQYLVEPLDLTEDVKDYQPESVRLVEEWREVMDNYTKEEAKTRTRTVSRVLIAEVSGSSEESVRFYGNVSDDKRRAAAHLVTNTALVAITESCSAQCVLDQIKKWTSVAENIKSNWMIGSVDSSRVTTRLNGTSRLNALHLMMMTLGGSVMTLYGDELAVRDGPDYHSPEKKNFLMPTERPQLSPMLWNNSINAGFTFTNVTPWMPLPPNYQLTSLQTQEAHGSSVNHITAFKRYIALRARTESLRWGALRGVTVLDGVLIYVREAEGFNRILVAINFGLASSTIDFHLYERTHMDEGRRLPRQMTIVSSTFNFRGGKRMYSYANGTTVDTQKMIYLEPSEGVVLSWSPSAESV